MHNEVLEPRRLLSASLRNGTLFIAGTSLDDLIAVTIDDGTITVSQTAGNAAARSSVFDQAAVRRIVVWGGEGDDEINIQATLNPFNDAARPPEIVAEVFAAGGDDRVATNLMCRLFGGAGDDVLSGDAGGSILLGGQGNDALAGKGAGNLLLGGSGNDTLRVGQPDTWWRLEGQYVGSTLIGGAGDDSLYGSYGIDYLDGGAGSDVILGGVGDTLVGGLGDDTLYGGRAQLGGAGADTLRARGMALMDGGNGDDVLLGDADNQIFRGGRGNDRIGDVGGAADIDGGTGMDTVVAPSGATWQNVERRAELAVDPTHGSVRVLLEWDGRVTFRDMSTELVTFAVYPSPVPPLRLTVVGMAYSYDSGDLIGNSATIGPLPNGSYSFTIAQGDHVGVTGTLLIPPETR